MVQILCGLIVYTFIIQLLNNVLPFPKMHSLLCVLNIPSVINVINKPLQLWIAIPFLHIYIFKIWLLIFRKCFYFGCSKHPFVNTYVICNHCCNLFRFHLSEFVINGLMAKYGADTHVAKSNKNHQQQLRSEFYISLLDCEKAMSGKLGPFMHFPSQNNTVLNCSSVS